MNYLIKILKIILSLTALLIVAFIIIFSHRDIPLDDLKIKYANSNSSFVAVNKMDVHFRDEGVQTDTIPIVLIHGTGASLHTFNSWSDRLKKSNRVIRVDLPAYGLTGPFPDENYTMANYTAFLKDFLIALNIKQCVLAGNSLGGAIAWNFTLEQPSMVTKLILINASGYPIASKSVPIAFSLAKIPVINKLLTFITPRFLVRSSVENVYFDNSKVTDLVVERYFNLTLRAGNRKAFVDRLKIPKDTSTHKNIKNIQQPTLILWGAEDLLIPVENAYKFQEDLPNNTLVILENTGHTPMEESPLESLAPVISFLKTAP
jgi:pimeloyl-ACP methyl ester carboxylesterase